MKSTFAIRAQRAAACLQQAAALVDPEVLNRPAGSLMALLLLARAMIGAVLASGQPNDV